MDLLGRLHRFGDRIQNTVEHYALGSGGALPTNPNIRGRLFRNCLGSFYIPNNTINDLVAQYIRRGELYDSDVVKEAESFVRPGTCVLDIGANFGQMSVAFSKLVGEDGLVYSFEANKLVFEYLRANAALNNPRIRPVYAAVFDGSCSEIRFPEPDLKKQPTYGSHGLDLTRPHEGVLVPALALDDMDFERPIAFMKIDIQGADIHALRGARKIIKRYRMPIVFEIEPDMLPRFNVKVQDYIEFVQEIGYVFEKIICDRNYLILPRN